MSATQISFAAFAASLLASAQSDAIESTPPASPELVLKHDGGLVAQAAAGGGECPLPFEGVLDGHRLLAFDQLRPEFRDAATDGLAGVGLDAPWALPSGGHAGFVFCEGSAVAYVKADGFGCWGRF